ncbi:Aste57867_9944 [Aphanomyces stellatus]|uniref:Aste57867_9944 protein n=1 Tax=Aphanomyces stellatus TaxID=120398 RepID=A0A485KP48_9STRA|nr:hypothetical protein As57867_009905 [Aphanomyces stellatus]VFT86822.1 Aste57867_9944 [Aphanomyces stellatus]
MRSKTDDLMPTPSTKTVLLSSELVELISAYQDGFFADMVPFINLENTTMQHGGLDCSIDLHLDGFDAEMCRVHSLMAPWLESHDIARLHKLFGHLPHVRVLIIMDAVYFGHLPLLHFVHDAHLFNFRSCNLHLMDLAAHGDRLDVLAFLHAVGHAGCSTHAMDVASKHGNLAMTHFLRQHRPDGFTGFGLVDAIVLGHMDVLEFLESPDVATMLDPKSVVERYDYPCTAIDIAADDGRLDVVEYLDRHGIPLTRRGLFMAVEKPGHEEIVAWLLDHARALVDANWSAATHRAIANGHLIVTQSLLAVQRDGDRLSLDRAATFGHLEVVQYLHDQCLVECTTAAMDGAAGNGHLDVVQWLHVHRTEGCTTRAMDTAAANNHTEVVQWLHLNRREGCTTNAMAGAAGNGHLDMLVWLYENRDEGCTTKAVDSAAEANHIEIVQWLVDNLDANCTTNAMDRAAKNGHLDMLEWLDAKFPDVGCSDGAFTMAGSRGHLHVLKWLSAKYPMPTDVLLEIDVRTTQGVPIAPPGMKISSAQQGVYWRRYHSTTPESALRVM